MKIGKVIALLSIILLVVSSPNGIYFINNWDYREVNSSISNLYYPNAIDIQRRFAGGNGTVDDPYQISNVTQLQDMELNLSASYVLVNDIDASETKKWNKGDGFIPIAQDTFPLNETFDGIPFTGILDGRGYNITSLCIKFSSGDNQGFFGSIHDEGRISNVSFLDIAITGNDNTGGITGNNYGKIINCTVSGSINGGDTVGGFAGSNSGILRSCSGHIFVSGSDDFPITGSDDYVGGITGFNKGEVLDCNGSGNVTGGDYVGGIAGYNDGKVLGCNRSGNVTGEDNTGGIAGYSNGTVDNCFKTGKVEGHENTGGLVGKNTGFLTNCSEVGNVTGGDHIGGVAGYNSGTIKNCSEMGKISGVTAVGGAVGGNSGTIENTIAISVAIAPSNIKEFMGNHDNIIQNDVIFGEVRGDYLIGGFVGNNLRYIQNSYAVCNVFGEGSVGGFVGSDGYGGHIGVKNSFYCINFTTVNNDRIPSRYGIYENQFSDWMKNNKKLKIDDYFKKTQGTENYKVKSSFDMKNMLPFSYFGHYRFEQKENIDLSNDPNFYIPFFSGIFDGSGYSISNVNISAKYDSRIGMFGTIEQDTMVLNVSLIDCNVSAGLAVGALIGYNAGTVQNCSATGRVRGVSRIGGLIGFNGIIVKRCFAAINVIMDLTLLKQSDYDSYDHFTAGGLVGLNGGRVSDSYATGNVTAFERGEKPDDYYYSGPSDCVGGLIGENGGIVRNCYATGNVTGTDYIGGLIGYNEYNRIDTDKVANCFWDYMTSGETYSGGGIKKSTTEMMTKSTYVDAGWDFDEVWAIVEHVDYPFLRWELTKQNNTNDHDNDFIPDIRDAFPFDPHASMDTDGDGLPDKWNENASELIMDTDLHLDAFPLDPAASIDNDGDGMPDKWNPGMDPNDSTSSPPLELDPYPDDPNNKKPSDISLITIIWLSVVVVVILIVVIIAVSGRRKKRLAEEKQDNLGRIVQNDIEKD